MCSARIEYVSKTQHYLRVKKPLLERERRARVNKCLDALKMLVAEFQGSDDILRMDKAEMLEATIDFVRSQHRAASAVRKDALPPLDGYCNGYMNAVNEVSRLMAATPGMRVGVGKTVMTHLGVEFNRLLNSSTPPARDACQSAGHNVSPPSPASSGYNSDCDYSDSDSATPAPVACSTVWRPW